MLVFDYYALKGSDSASVFPDTVSSHVFTKRFRLQMTQGENMKLTPTELSEPVLGLQSSSQVKPFAHVLKHVNSASNGFQVGSV